MVDAVETRFYNHIESRLRRVMPRFVAVNDDLG